MKKYLLYILILVGINLTSCEEVVEVDLKTDPEKLVIDANLYVDVENPTLSQVIKLSKTVGFYDSENFNPFTGAQVWIDDSLGNQYQFIDSNQNGHYTCSNFIMNLNTTYTLHVIANGESYTAEEIFYNTPEIAYIEQKDDGGFLGDNFEFRIWFQDNALQENYYQLIDNATGKTEFDVKDDTFSNGNLMNFIVSDSDLEIGDSVNITFSETSKSYYLYMQKLLSVSQNTGNPFASPIGVIRGNIINNSNPDNYPLGIFSLQKAYYKTLTVQ